MKSARASTKKKRAHGASMPPGAGTFQETAAAPGHPSIAARISRKLEEDVVLGRRHPRERLVEQDLCDEFKTHRGDVRLALFELEKKGIVRRIPNRGAVVRDLSPKEVSDIYGVREELEVMALRILPFPVPAEAVARLEVLQRQHSDAIDANDLLTVHYSNVEFHRTLFSLCGNDCLIETIENLAQKVSSIRSYAHAQPDALDNSRRDHAKMIEALRASGREQLISVARRHLKPAVQAYIRAYGLRFGAPAQMSRPEGRTPRPERRQ
jgi:DNA-binding GntR family transcriptional regulator